MTSDYRSLGYKYIQCTVLDTELSSDGFKEFWDD